jgi:hypothetical protein
VKKLFLWLVMAALLAPQASAQRIGYSNSGTGAAALGDCLMSSGTTTNCLMSSGTTTNVLLSKSP